MTIFDTFTQPFRLRSLRRRPRGGGAGLCHRPGPVRAVLPPEHGGGGQVDVSRGRRSGAALG